MTQADSKPGRGRIYDDITQTMGDTPLVRLNKLAREAGVKADILLKLEFFNPLASVKDRIGVAMIEALEAKGLLRPDSVLIEPGAPFFAGENPPTEYLRLAYSSIPASRIPEGIRLIANAIRYS